jgi:anti-sigma factor RsiW
MGFVVGEAEPWVSPTDLSTGCALWKQGVAAKRELADKYGDFGVHPQHRAGSITVGGSQETGLQGAVAHLAIWNRVLWGDEIAAIWSAGASDLRTCAMYHSFI